jgi:hypothetical protein
MTRIRRESFLENDDAFVGGVPGKGGSELTLNFYYVGGICGANQEKRHDAYGED